jgi:hypothetical protein
MKWPCDPPLGRISFEIEDLDGVCRPWGVDARGLLIFGV